MSPAHIEKGSNGVACHKPDQYIPLDPVKSFHLNGDFKHIEVIEPVLMQETVRQSAPSGEAHLENGYSVVDDRQEASYGNSTGVPVENFRPMRVIVIGAGFSGIYCGVRIPERLRNIDLCIYDKNAGVGGTWFENRCVQTRYNLILRESF
jgi:hypothetical protein